MHLLTYAPVVVSAVVSYLASAVWFMVLFRAPYVAGLGKTTEELAKGPSGLVASVFQVIGNIVMAAVLALLMNRLGYTTLSQGLMLGALVWLGFVAAVLGPMYAFEAFSFSFFLITAGSVLVSLLITGAILGGWQV